MPLRRAHGRIRTALAPIPRIGRSLARAARIGVSRPGRPVRVGIDIRPFYEPLTGVGWYLYFLLERLAAMPDLEIVCFGDPVLSDAGPRLHVELPGGIELLGCDFRGIAPTRFGHLLASASWPAHVWLTRCDLVFGANYFLPRALSAAATRRVITVHDLTFRRFPELIQRETLQNLEREMPREVHRADGIVCVSNATREDLLRTYRVDPRKVRAILSGPPPGRAAGAPRLELPPRYVLFVSTIEPRKNLGALVEAFERLKDEGYPGELVVAGRVGWKSEPMLRRLEASRWAGAIRRLDYVDRDQLPWLYRKADVFVLPSRYEGFGFPVLEAMAEGTPVIAARNSSLPEIGGEAAVYFNADDPRELAAALTRVIGDAELRRGMVERGRANLARFSWDRAAAETAALFRRVAGR
ncbi:MAG TPA: glycosyltransferase family 1 protein [Thermoanaerobaculia bacterium]|nr:glycosyltransferase family 1 protein [Thermoanaerobaculia bacterium]